MLKKVMLFASRSNWMRQAAKNSFHLPLIGASLRKVAGGMLPRGQRTWVQIHNGPGEGLWIKVEPYWEPGYLQGEPEPAIQEIMVENLKKGGCFYDIGAHIGYYALIAARLVGPEGCVIGFEPDPENVAVCEENINKNNFRQASVVAAAVWSSNGQMSFERGEDGPSRMGGHVIQENPAAGQPKQMVTCPAVTLDEFCKSHRPPTFLMIDAEGGELEVLMGARATLEQFRPDLLIEVHSPESLPAVRALLEPFGYQVRPVAMHPDKLHVYCTRGV